MNALIQLLLRHGLASLGAWFAAHNISGDSTTSIIIGVLAALISVIWSAFAKWLHIDDQKFNGITNSEMFRVALGALASQAVTWLSTYFAIDANNPELLGVAVVNAAASKFGAHQKLAFLGEKDAVHLFVLGSLLFACVSCTPFQKQEAITFGKRVAISAGEAAVILAEMQLASMQSEYSMALMNGASPKEVIAKKLAVSAAQEALEAAHKALAKERAKLDNNPVNVQPRTQSREPETEPTSSVEPDSPPPCEEPRGDDSAPRCLQITVVPLRPPSLPLSLSSTLAGSGTPQPQAHPDTSARVMRPPAILIPRYGEQVAQHLSSSYYTYRE